VDSGGGSGTLTVTDGTTSGSVNLIGTYTSGNFVLTSDGNGGTEVYDPPIVPNGGTVTSGGSSNPALVTSGGSGGANDMAGFFNGLHQLVAAAAPPTSGQQAGGHLDGEFNHALFTNYAATLSDEKQFGPGTPIGGNPGESVTSTGIAPPDFNHHHG